MTKFHGLVCIIASFISVQATAVQVARWQMVESLAEVYPWFGLASDHPLTYHPLEKAESERIENRYGALYLAETKGKESVFLSRPWAGHWYPLSDKAWYSGSNSPLGKLSYWLKRQGYNNQIIEKEGEIFGSFKPETWEGFCDAWAMASVRYPEPTRPIQSQGMVFSVSDQKALLTRLHENYKKEMFGILYRGDFKTDGTYQDLRPESFHHVLTTHLKQGEYLLMDEDPGADVWTKPIFGYEYEVTPDEEFEAAYKVTAHITFVSERSEETEVPTTLQDTLRAKYQFRLFYDPSDSNDSGYRVIAGEWLNDSYQSHPDVFFTTSQENGHQTSNTEINRLLEPIKKLFKSSQPTI